MREQVREITEKMQKQLHGLEEQLNVKGRANELTNVVREGMQTAHKQFSGLEEEVQRFVNRMQERLANTQAEGIKKLDDVLRTLAINEFVEKVRAIEMFKHGNDLKHDLLERVGLVSREEMTRVEETVAKVRADLIELKKKTTNLSKRPMGVTKQSFNTLKRRVEEMEKTAKTNGSGSTRRTTRKTTTTTKS